MSLMDDPRLLVQTVVRWTLTLTAVSVGASVALGVWQMGVGLVLGVLALGVAVGFFVLITRLLRPQQNRLFPRMLMLSNPLKYPLLLLIVYLAVRGGILMTLGFVVGVVLPLAVITGIAIREALRSR